MRYTLPEFVEDLQKGANNLLMHWHYYRRQTEPLSITDRQSSMLAKLTPEEFGFVLKAYRNMRTPSRRE